MADPSILKALIFYWGGFDSNAYSFPHIERWQKKLRNDFLPRTATSVNLLVCVTFELTFLDL
ncbi:hypothetical protein Csa_017796 [Cucumis sativus]|nr:hypothetical protein Csa_017796 [Cucumis sativus]